MVYVREIDGRELTLLVGGMLWRDALVMVDEETGSHWSQITGEAFRGELAGTTLPVYPSEMTTWSAWRRAHPRTRVLRKPPGEREAATVYDRYYADADRLGIFGRSSPDDRLPAKTVVVAVEVGRASTVFPLDDLPRDRVVRAEVGDEPVAVVPGPGGGFAAFRAAEGRALPELGLDPAGRLTDGTAAWDPVTGVSVGAPDLAPVRAHVLYWFGWASFRPEAAVWDPSGSR